MLSTAPSSMQLSLQEHSLISSCQCPLIFSSESTVTGTPEIKEDLLGLLSLAPGARQILSACLTRQEIDKSFVPVLSVREKNKSKD